MLTIIIKLESNEIRKIPVILLPFLNLKNIIPRYILYKFLVCPFYGLDPYPYLKIIPSYALEDLVYFHFHVDTLKLLMRP